MKATLLVAAIGFLLAIIDFTGASRWVEAKIRKAMHALLSAGVADIVTSAKLLPKALGVILALGLFLYVGGMLRLDFIPHAFHEPPQAIDFTQFFIALLSVFAAGIAMIALYCVLWVLSLPKRGVVSTVGLLMAAAGLVLELVY